MQKFQIDSSLKVVALVICGILIGTVSGMSAAGTWTAPTSAPPGGNVAAPINTGSVSQVRAGSLGIGVSSVGSGFALDVSGASRSSSLGLGVTSIGSGLLLDVNGRAVINTLGVVNMVVSTGSPAVGKVLTAMDSSGTVSWQSATSSVMAGIVPVTYRYTGTGSQNLGTHTYCALSEYSTVDNNHVGYVRKSTSGPTSGQWILTYIQMSDGIAATCF